VIEAQSLGSFHDRNPLSAASTDPLIHDTNLLPVASTAPFYSVPRRGGPGFCGLKFSNLAKIERELQKVQRVLLGKNGSKWCHIMRKQNPKSSHLHVQVMGPQGQCTVLPHI